MPIPTKSRRVMLVVALLVLLGAVTDDLSSHKASSLAISALSDWFGQGIQFVAPASGRISTAVTAHRLDGDGAGVESTSSSLPRDGFITSAAR